MNAAEAFREELRRTANAVDAQQLLPDRIARACVAVLPFDAAGLSITLLPGRRFPLGSSDPTAAAAERLQFALGEGPCATAQQEHAVVVAMGEELTTRWPVYSVQLTAHTPYRMTAALPVGGPLAHAVVLDLYRRRPGRPSPGVIDATLDVAGAAGVALADGLAEDAGEVLGLPPALRTPAVEARYRVWRAIGHATMQLRVSSVDSLAALRALAFQHDTDLESIADRILAGELSIPAVSTADDAGRGSDHG